MSHCWKDLKMNKQPEITDATRDAFISAFFTLAKSKSIRYITIKEITGLAGYNRTTFYRYFSDIYEILEYVEDEYMDIIQRGILHYFSKTTGINSEFFSLFLDTFKAKKDILLVLLDDENKTSFIKRLQHHLTNNTNLSIKKTYRSQLIMEAYFTGVFSAIAMHLKNPDKLSDDELAILLQDLFTHWFWPEVSE